MSSTVSQQAVQRAGLGAGGGVLPFAPADILTLYQSYMPFIKGGGLYVPTPKKYDLGHEVFVLVKMPGESDRVPAVGKVVWVNRSGTSHRPSGIGIQFTDSPENAVVRDRIEVLVAGIPPDTATFTM